MILKNRLYKREQPSKEAKSVFIFCEGAKRERDYFSYFVNIDSRINIEVYPINDQEDNSPLGLLKIAEECILGSNDDSKPKPKYDFREGDEVWIVLDIDKDKFNSRDPQFDEIRKKCENTPNWYMVLSNPCFEVWLYFHLYATKAEELSEECKVWKSFVNSSVTGGFDARKHPVYIGAAICNAEKNFQLEDDKPNIGCTEVYKLGNSIFPMIEDKIKLALEQLGDVDK